MATDSPKGCGQRAGGALLDVLMEATTPRASRRSVLVVNRLAYGDNTISSTPLRRRCPLRTICGSKLPARSRATSISTRPVLSVCTVLARVPLRMPYEEVAICRYVPIA